MAVIDEALERLCIAVRRNGTVLYLYPVDMELVRQGAQVLTRSGVTVRRLHLRDDGRIGGVLGAEELTWDAAGRFIGPYLDHDNDLYISERYFDPRWKYKRRMSNAEWSAAYGREHPFCAPPAVKDPAAGIRYSQIENPVYDDGEGE